MNSSSEWRWRVRGQRKAGCGASSAIHLRRPTAEREAVGAGVRRGRRPVAEKGAAQKDRIGIHAGSLWGPAEGTVSHGASRIRKAPVETWVSEAS